MTWATCRDARCRRWHCAHPQCGAHPQQCPDRACTHHHAYCASCEQLIRGALASIPHLHNALRLMLPTGQHQGEQVSGTRNPPLPAGAQAAINAIALRDLLIGWEDALRDLRGWTRWSQQQRTAETAGRWLLRRVDYLLASDAARDFGLELLREARIATLQCSADDLIHRLPVPCPQCDTLALIRYDGDGQVRCANCWSNWPQEHYEWLVHVLAADTA